MNFIIEIFILKKQSKYQIVMENVSSFFLRNGNFDFEKKIYLFMFQVQVTFSFAHIDIQWCKKHTFSRAVCHLMLLEILDGQMSRCPDARIAGCPDAQMSRCPDAQMKPTKDDGNIPTFRIFYLYLYNDHVNFYIHQQYIFFKLVCGQHK